MSVVIDLDSQLDAVKCYISGWDRPRILSWLRRFGRVDGPYSSFGEMWIFFSSYGPAADFLFSERNELVIPGRKKRISKGVL